MTTGTIIFIVVLVVQWITRIAAKQAAAKKTAETHVAAMNAAPMQPQRPTVEASTGAPGSVLSPHLQVVKERIERFAQDGPAGVVQALREQWAEAVAEEQGITAPATMELELDLDAPVAEEEDPVGESSGAYLRQRAAQIHAGALAGRHPHGRQPSRHASPSTAGTPAPVLAVLATRHGLREAVVASEVLGPPLSLRRP